MALSNSTYEFFDHSLLPAILISLGIHVLAIAVLNPFRIDAAKLVAPLEIVLQTPPKPEPPPPPEPPKPEPPKPLPKKVPPPPVKIPLPPPQENRVVAPPPSLAPPPAVIAATPVKDTEPTFAAPAPPTEIKKPVEPPPVDVDANLGQYSDLLAREFAKHRQYPRIAVIRGWQGEVRIKLDISNGSITSSTVTKSSGFEVLDNQALESAKKASIFPPLPDTLRNRSFAITVPVMFRLE